MHDLQVHILAEKQHIQKNPSIRYHGSFSDPILEISKAAAAVLVLTAQWASEQICPRELGVPSLSQAPRPCSTGVLGATRAWAPGLLLSHLMFSGNATSLWSLCTPCALQIIGLSVLFLQPRFSLVSAGLGSPWLGLQAHPDHYINCMVLEWPIYSPVWPLPSQEGASGSWWPRQDQENHQ